MDSDDAQERMNKVWEYNNVASGYFHTTVCAEAFKYGFALVENRYINRRTRLPSTGRTGPQDVNEVLYVLQESYLTIPVPRKDQRNELGAVIRVLMENRLNVLWVGDNPNIVGLEYIDDNIWYRWRIDTKLNERSSSAVQIPVLFGNLTNRNPYRDVRTMFSLYRNPGDSSFNMDGYSDLTDIIDQQLAYNEVASDEKHVIQHQTFPITLFTGMDVGDDYTRGVSDVLSAKNSEADGKILSWDASLEANADFLDRLERQIRETSGYSPITDGDLAKIGQIRNLRGAMVPDIMTTKLKQLYFTMSEQEHAAATLNLIEWHENANWPSEEFYEDKTMDMTWHDEFVPQDELTAAEAQSIRVKMGLDSIHDIVRRLHPELESGQEVDEYIRNNRKTLLELGLMQEEQEPQLRQGEQEKETQQS